MRRPRLFSLMLTAFALVIVLGVGGMAGFFWLAVAIGDHDRTMMGAELAARAEASRLTTYYGAVGSWRGVELRVDPLGYERGVVTLLDAGGRVVAGPPASPELAPAGAGQTIRRLPIYADGAQVGTLVFAFADDEGQMAPAGFDGRRVAQGMLSAGLALAAILLLLAAYFARRISSPLRQISAAAAALAAGDGRARARPARVRELADLAESFNRMADSLQQADQQRRQLTADIAHELRTPLSIVKGRLEGVQDGVYVADAEQVAGLLGEVALLERLIDDLRLLALADAGQLPLHREAIDPASLLREAARSFAQPAADRGVAIELAPGAGLGEIDADPQRVAQVLGNLVANALRHTPAAGRVTIAASAEPAAVVFTVSDTGQGIAAADLPHIFERFYRADRSRARSSGGAGLGLAIARRLIEAHGGQIWATSEIGRGTCVSFRLPRAAAPEHGTDRTPVV